MSLLVLLFMMSQVTNEYMNLKDIALSIKVEDELDAKLHTNCCQQAIWGVSLCQKGKSFAEEHRFVNRIDKISKKTSMCGSCLWLHDFNIIPIYFWRWLPSFKDFDIVNVVMNF